LKSVKEWQPNLLEGSWVIEDTTNYDIRSITYHLQTLGFVQKFKINSLDNEKNLVVALTLS
jgi:hypothetical protein